MMLVVVDHGPSKNFPVHQTLAKHNKYGLENVASLDTLVKHAQREFFTLDILPMKIGNGTGAPCRIIARLESTERNTNNWFGLLIFCLLVFVGGLAMKTIYDFKYNSNKDF